MQNLLILGGTTEARLLAERSDPQPNWRVTTSLAGRVRQPRLPVGEVRVGGFGGAQGLTTYLRDHGVDAVVDATHPFAMTMSDHAAHACAATDVPLLRFARPGWSDHPLAATWHWVSSYNEAARTTNALGNRPFLTTGRQTLHHFAHWTDRDVLVRIVEPLDDAAPARWTIVHTRGPYWFGNERKLLQGNAIDVLLTKDSGGNYTAAKLEAANALRIPVVVVWRPITGAHIRKVNHTDAVLEWLRALPPR